MNFNDNELKITLIYLRPMCLWGAAHFASQFGTFINKLHFGSSWKKLQTAQANSHLIRFLSTDKFKKIKHKSSIKYATLEEESFHKRKNAKR